MAESAVLERVASAVADREAVRWDRIGAIHQSDAIARRTAAFRTIDRAVSSPNQASADSMAAARRPLPLAATTVLCLAAITAAVAVLTPTAWASSPAPVAPGVTRLVTLAFAVAGLLLVRSADRDARAAALGGFFLCLSAGAGVPLLPVESPASWLARSASSITNISPDAFLAYFIWRFASEFPRRSHFGPADRVARVGTTTSAWIGCVLFAANVLLALPHLSPESRQPLELAARRAAGIYWLSLSLLSLSALLVAWFRTRGAAPGESARFRWFVGGLAFGITPLLVAVLAEATIPAFAAWVAQPRVRLATGLVLFALLLTIPVSSTYSVLAHRVLNLRFVIHRAAVFTFARGTMLSLALLPSLGFVVHLYDHRHIALGSLFRDGTAWIWLATVAVAWSLYASRHPVRRRLEVWLVGSVRPTAPTLAAFVRQARQSYSLEELTTAVQEQLAALVGASRATLLLYARPSSDGDRRARGAEAAADQPAGRWVSVDGDFPPLADGSGTVFLARGDHQPVPVQDDDRDSLYAWLMEGDRTWVQETGTALVAALTTTPGQVRALLVVGRSRSGVPYGAAEREAVAALAGTASLALERILRTSSSAPKRARPAGQCPCCGKISSLDDEECGCGGRLSPAALPLELAGKYRLDRVLGAGGMGVVYRAFDLELQRFVALKTLPRVDSDILDRLRREARSMAGFVHPNLALLFAVESWKEMPVLVVEYLAGGSLAARLPPALRTREALELAIAIAGALEAMHRRGLVHRDVKPQNIAFTTEGTPKLLDFGLAQLPEGATGIDLDSLDDSPFAAGARLTLPGSVVGTPLYLSPEILRGEPPTPAQDLWSLHLVLWESLTGYHPLADLPASVVLLRLREAELPWEVLRKAGLPGPTIQILRSGLSPHLHDRPPDAAAARRALIEAMVDS